MKRTWIKVLCLIGLLAMAGVSVAQVTATRSNLMNELWSLGRNIKVLATNSS